MLDEVLYLTPDAPNGPDREAMDSCDLAPTNPPIMIPGINADETLYPIEKIQAHIEGVHHLALSVFIFDGDELLIQRRAFEKYHCGGQWANTCCTHPHFGEDIAKAAHRRLTEELGFTVPVEEKLIIEYSANVGGGLWERERVHMFRADVKKEEIEENLNPEEVCEINWVTGDALRKYIAKNPAEYTPWFRIYLNRYPNLNF